MLHRLRCALLSAALLCLGSASFAQAPLVSHLGLLPGDTAVHPAVANQLDHAVSRGGDQFLVVWSDARGQSIGGGTQQSATDIFGIRLDAQGNPIDTAPFLVAGGMGTQERPLVAWNGSVWLVLYISQDPVGGYYDNVMRAVRVSAAGQVLDATPLSFPPTQYTPNTIGLQLSGQNGQWLVTRCIYHADGYGTYLAGQRIDGSGSLLDSTPIVLLDWIYGASVSLAANGEFLVAGTDWNGLATYKAQRVGANGQPVGAPFSVPSLAIASSGSEYYVAWFKDAATFVGSRMSTSGVLTTPAGTTILSNVTQFGDMALGHDGTNWWLEWGVNDQLHTLRISGAGVVLDPGGGPLLPISITGNVTTAYTPKLVGRPGGGVLFFWYDYRAALGTEANVFTLPIGPTNAAATERLLSTGTRSQRAPDLAAGPAGTSAIAFVSEAANDRRVLVHLLDAAGQPTTATPIEVAATTGTRRVGIAWNGSVYLVVWDGGVTGDPALQVEARRMNPNGSFVDVAPFDVMAGFDPDVDALGEDFLVACARVTSPQTISAYYRVMDGPTAAPVTPATPLGGVYVAVGPRVHTDGSRWIVTYESHWSHDATQSDALYHFVTPAGVATASANPAATSGGSGTPDVAFGAGKYLFVWRNNSLANANNYIAGRMMNADGSFATGNVVIAEAAGRQLRPVVGFDGTNFLVVWDDQRNQGSFFDERTDVYGARVSPAGAVLDAGGFVVHAGPQGDAVATLLSHSDGRSLVACASFLPSAVHDSYRIGLTSLQDSDLLGVAPEASVATALAGVPNPFRAGTVLRFALARAEFAQVTIHDLQGRRVRSLASRSTPAGEHALAWDGRDDAGVSVAPGVYLARLTTPTLARVARVVRIGE